MHTYFRTMDICSSTKETLKSIFSNMPYTTGNYINAYGDCLDSEQNIDIDEMFKLIKQLKDQYEKKMLQVSDNTCGGDIEVRYLYLSLHNILL